MTMIASKSPVLLAASLSSSSLSFFLLIRPSSYIEGGVHFDCSQVTSSALAADYGARKITDLGGTAERKGEKFRPLDRQRDGRGGRAWWPCSAHVTMRRTLGRSSARAGLAVAGPHLDARGSP